MTRFLAPRVLSLIALGVLASSSVAGGCGGNSNVTPQRSGAGGSTAGRGATSGGTSGRSGSGGKGGHAGTMNVDDGGDAGEASGGTGGGSAGKSGNGGSGGKSGSAGTSNGGGGAQGGTAGQAGGTGGQSGSAGNGGAGMVGMLGTQCSPPGALACAGNYQKLTVLCGGDGTWQPNQTCGDDAFCDSMPGPSVGTCQPVAAGCEDGPGTTFCDDADLPRLVRCTADAVRTSIESCNGMCRERVCRAAPPCPVWSDYGDHASCTTECPGAFDGCGASSQACPMDLASIYLMLGDAGIVRSMWAEDTCQVCNGTGNAILDVDVNVSAGRAIRVTVPSPWKYLTDRTFNCGGAVEGCVVLQTRTAALRFVSSTPQDGPANILFEDVPMSATCPSDGGEGGQSG
jgi:hypothetical protein